jgi:cytochrome c peroxidase
MMRTFIFSAAMLGLSMSVHAQVAADATRIGPLFKTINGAQSFVRIYDTGTAPGTVTVNILEESSSRVLATWSATIPAQAAKQFSVAEIEAAAQPALPTSTTRRIFAVTATFPGYVQHLVYNAADGALSVVSGCGAHATSQQRYINNVHTNTLATYPSAVVVQNTAAQDKTATFDVYDAITGARVGGYSGLVRANSSWVLTQSTFATATGYQTPASQYHLNFVLNPEFTGFAQHVITARDTGLATNMAEVCTLPGTASDGLLAPALPTTAYNYTDAAVNLPNYYSNPNAPGSVAADDNTPTTNPITDAGAALGRVLFYDKRLSINNTVACASCHQQAHGFSDPVALSKGFNGGSTARHSMGLSNARYYRRGRFFWDERAATLEDQVLQPIQNEVEMGLTLTQLTTKLSAVDYYAPLFKAAFGSTEITSDRISRALAQFVRSLTTYQSKYDAALQAGPNAINTSLTAQERQGLQLFGGPLSAAVQTQGRTLGCARCHDDSAQIAPAPRNNGLTADITTDPGAGQGRFKVPSLRNIAVRGTFMHDGRFRSLSEVIDFYSTGIQANAGLDQALRNNNGNPVRFNITQTEKDALIAYLNTLTDPIFLADPKFGDPFKR